jgi:hypothetical protein
MDYSSASPSKGTSWKVRYIELVRRHSFIMWIAETLGAKLLDPDEKVRAAVCKLYSQLDYETALHHVSEAQLRRVAERGLDKKVTSSRHYFFLIIHEFSVRRPG